MITKILVPTDFSEPSMKGIDSAIELARRFRAKLVIMFVLEPIPYIVPADPYGSRAHTGMLLAEERRFGREQLAKLAKTLQKRGLEFETVLSSGTPYQRIVEAAKKFKADLIVMATHGRSGFSHLLLGSVTEKVVRSASCPVLTVRGEPPPRRRRKR